MSSYKAAIQGDGHKRVPADIAVNPIIIGHEFCGEIVEVGSKWANQFKVGERFSIQPALNDPSNIHAAPGYSFKYIGGGATYVVIPATVMEHGCLLSYSGDAFYYGSLAEPMSCIIGAFHANYHTVPGSYNHVQGIVPGGKMALMAGAGPMGLGAIDYALHTDRRPALLVVTDIDEARLQRASELYTVSEAAGNGVTLHYVNTSGIENVPAYLKDLSGGGYDDVFVFAPVAALIEQADAILGYDGCLNFFAGPTNPDFSATLNFYNVHYMATHVAGNSGGTTSDMLEALEMMSCHTIDPSSMVTHIGGLNSVIETTLNLPEIPGGKKLIYNQIDFPMTAISDFEKLGASDPLFKELSELTAKNKGLWSLECEKYLLANAKAI
jgi:threonine dehydrogenase-like Zn-dependent dehydrogenase